jgi:CRP/FNR family transcriptional regulator
MDQIRQASVHNATWKVCNLLLIFADRFGVIYDGKVLIREKISQQMLSNLLGINRITVVRVIKDLKNEALLEQIDGFYCIRSVERLKKYQKTSTAFHARFDGLV